MHECLQHIFYAAARLVAHGHHVGHSQVALLHRQIYAHIAALGNHSYSALHGQATMFVWPQGNTIECVDVSVAIRAKYWHVCGNLYELRLQIGVTSFGEPGCVTHRATCPHVGKLDYRINGEVSVNGNKCCIGYAGQISQRLKAGDSVHVLFRWMDRPDLARET